MDYQSTCLVRFGTAFSTQDVGPLLLEIKSLESRKADRIIEKARLTFAALKLFEYHSKLTVCVLLKNEGFSEPAPLTYELWESLFKTRLRTKRLQ